MDRTPPVRGALVAILSAVVAGCCSGATGVAPPGGSPPPVASSCSPLAPPQGNIINVTPAQTGALPGIVAGAAPGDVIRLADGTYPLNGALLRFQTPRMTLRSASGNPRGVILDGNYQGGAIVQINASDITIAEITVQRAFHQR